MVLLAPGAARAGEHIGGAGIIPRGGIVSASSHHDGVAGDSYRQAEVVIRRGVIGEQMVLLAPGAARAGEHIGGAGIIPRGGVVVPRTHDNGVAGDRRRTAEPVTRRSVVSKQMVLLAPGAARAGEHIGGAGIIPRGGVVV